MKSSLYLVAAGAVLATAGPLDKRAMKVEWVTDVVTVTVTADPVTPTAFVENSKPKAPETTSAAPPPPPPAKPAPKPSPKPAPKPAPKPVAAAAAEKPKPPPPSPKVETPKAKPVVIQTPSTPPPSSSPSAPGASNDYQRVVLEQHNLHRSNHSASALSWDNGLAQQAQAWAQGCVFEHNRSGQNLASAGNTGGLSSKSEAAAKGITDQWYNGEISNYQYYGMSNPPSNANLMEWGHFTQVVWKNTQKVGCATVSCPAGTIFGMEAMYTVCNYEPAGNFGGQYGNNVLRPSGLQVSTV